MVSDTGEVEAQKGSDTGSVAAIVPAAGIGKRFGGPIAKLFAPLRGMPLLAQTLRALQASAEVRWIVVVVQPEARVRTAALLARYGITKALPPCEGAASRAASVARGLATLPEAASWVLVHDGARPCLTPALVRRVVGVAKRQGAVACGLPAAVTVKSADETQQVRLTLDRQHLWFVQTPQVFRRHWFVQAVAQGNGALSQFPDDAALLESAGFPVQLVEGDPLNIKVTTREDLMLAEAILAARNGRPVKSKNSKGKTTRQNSKVA
jgi:2-C-methyl-D-erythritol 4-phosphate cytidylyltransferase